MEPRGLLYRIASGASDAPLDLRESVLAHLRVLLNCRQGSAPCAPDLGMPDFSELAHAFPEAVHQLQRMVKATIETYEPRLRNVVVRQIPDESALQVRLEISAVAVDERGRGNLTFATTLGPGGQLNVR